MKFHYSTYRIKLLYPFTIARSSHDYYDIIYVYLTENGVTGIGEAAPSNRYGESFEQIIEWVSGDRFQNLPEFESLDSFIKKLHSRCSEIRSLKAAFDIAAHDLWGKLNDISLCHHFHANPDETPITSFTIGIDNLDVIKQKIVESEPYPVLKVKLGTDYDRDIITKIRNLTDKPIRVDANEGWNLEQAQRMCDWLSKQNIEFVEQPLPTAQLEDMVVLKGSSPLKLFADESCLTSEDIPTLDEAFHGINIKLMKSGGLREAYKMIQLAKESGLEIMLGCMIESSVAVTAAAHLSPLIDYADLDGNILIKNDPFTGVALNKGKLVLPNTPGLGVQISLNNSSGLAIGPLRCRNS